MATIDELVRTLRGFDERKEVVKALRKELPKPTPEVAARIRARATEILPHSGGLGEWVAAARIGSSVAASGRTVTVTLRGGRSAATGKKSNLRRIDQGFVRHPPWGHRERAWSTEAVPAGFFTEPATQASEWHTACQVAVAKAFRSLDA